MARHGWRRRGPSLLRLLGANVLALCGLAFAEPGTESSAERRLDTTLKVVLSASGSIGAASLGPGQGPGDVLLRLRGPARRLGPRLVSAGEPRLLLVVKHLGDAADLEAVGFRIQGRVGPVFTGSLAAGRLRDLAELPEVVFVSTSRRLGARWAQPSRSGGETSAALPPSGREATTPDNLTGAGVLVASIDTGVDVFHQDFRKADGSTRIKYLLDLSDPGDADQDGDLDGSGPYGGTLYTEGDINAALLGSGGVAQRDTTGHGTHGLSIAAGDDSAQPGVAPAADLLVVKATREDGTLGFESVDVVSALAFVDEKAAELGRPYVVNLSLGTIFGSHDGRSLEEQAIDSLVGPGIPGKVAVVAAGNASDNRGTRYRHFRGTSYAGFAQASNSHGLVVPAYTASPGQGNDRVVLTLWQKGRDRNRISVQGPGCPAVSADFGDYQDVQTACGDVFIANMGGANPLNGDVESIVLIDDWSGTPPRAGAWTITITGEEIGDTGEYDGWLGEESLVGAASPYLSANADNLRLVGKPGGAYHAITVGSHALEAPGSRYRTTWQDVQGIPRVDTSAVSGDISDFSSPGGTRDGRVKPELVAPGERVLGAVSRDALPATSPTSIYRFHPFPEANALLTDSSADHAFGMLQGTSFAAPVVAGLAARILGEAPGLDAVQVRNVLVNSATVDAFVTAGGPVPNPTWGYGKALTSIGGAPLPSTLRITTESLAGGVVGEPYQLVFTAAGGTPPYTWSRSSGAFPAGLALAGSLLSGTPGAPGGSFAFTIRVEDSASPPRVASRTLTLDVLATSPLRITTPVLPAARLARAYAESLEAVGGTPPYVFTLVGGALPPGFTLGPDGVVQGTAAALVQTAFTVRLADAASGIVHRSFTLRVLGEGGDDWRGLGYLGTTVNAISVDPAQSNRAFATTSQLDGIFLTTDAGETWQAVGTEKAGIGATRIGAEQLEIGSAPAPAAVLTSARQGNFGDWSEWVMTYDPAADVWQLRRPCPDTTAYGRFDALDRDAAGHLYVLSNGLVGCPSYPGSTARPFFFRSTDGGVNWTSPGSINTGVGSNASQTFGSLSVARSDPSRAYVSRSCGYWGPPICDTPDGTFTSANGGATWTDVSTGTRRIRHVKASATNPLDVLRAGDTFVQRSLDGGATWNVVFTAPSGGTIYGFDRGTSAPQLVLAGAGPGLYKSENGGQNWTELLVNGRAPNVSTLAIDPGDGDRFWIADFFEGIFVSSDRGATWSRRNAGLVQRDLVRLAVADAAPDELVLTGTGGVHLSRSSGDRWVAMPNSPSARWLGVAPTNPDRYYAVQIFGGLWRSDDRGVTWRQPNAGFGSTTVPPGDWISAFVVSPAQHDTVLVNLCPGNPSGSNGHPCEFGGARLRLSTDGGVSWSPLPGTGIDPAARIDALAFARDVPGRVYLFTSAGVYRSSDGGTNWSRYGAGTHPTFAWIAGVAVAPSDSNYVYAGDHYFDPAVGSWQSAVLGLRSPESIAVDPRDPRIAYRAYLAGTPGSVGLYKTVDGGRTWSPLAGPFGYASVNDVVVDPTRPDTVYAVTRYTGVFRSDDGGVTWRQLGEYGTLADVVNQNVEDPSNPNLLLAGTAGYGVQASTNRGQSYVPRVTGLANLYVNAVAFDPALPSVVYAATDGGLFRSTDSAGTWTATSVTGKVTDVATHSDGVARRVWATVAVLGVAASSDGGASFSVYSAGLDSLQLTGLEVEVSGQARRVWATTSGGSGVVFSDDDGRTWRSASGNGLTDRDVSDLAISGGAARRVWATTASGVYSSNDSGSNWSSVSQGLPSGVPVTSVAVDPNSQEVLVSLSAKEAGGVYRGGNLNGVWSAYSSGLDDLRVRRVSRGSSRVVAGSTRATTFYASTSGAGVFAAELRSTATGTLAVTTTALPDATLTVPYSATLLASGGTPPYSWSVAGASLPPGLALQPSTGRIEGAPGQTGTYPFTVQVVDAGQQATARSFSITVLDPTPRLRALDLLVGLKPGPAGTARVPVTLSPASAEAVEVDYATADGTGISGTHFLPATGRLLFAPGQVAKAVDVALLGNVPAGQNRTFHLNLSDPVNAPIARSRGRVTLVNGDVLFTVAPCRLVDTRSSTHAPALAAGETRTFTLSGRCGIPPTARALSLNVTITAPTAQGHLTLFPAGQGRPVASSLNYAPGQTRANNVIIRVDAQGRLSVTCSQATGTAELILDVNAYLE